MGSEVLYDIDLMEKITELCLRDVLSTDLFHRNGHRPPLSFISVMTSFHVSSCSMVRLTRYRRHQHLSAPCLSIPVYVRHVMRVHLTHVIIDQTLLDTCQIDLIEIYQLKLVVYRLSFHPGH